MKLRPFALPLALALVAGTAAAQIPMDPLDARDARRLDRMEQVVRELRAIVFQGRDSGRPVVVQPAETDYQLQEIGRRIADLEQSLMRTNGDLELVTRDLDLARRDNETLRRENQRLADKVTTLEQQMVGAGPAEEAPPAPVSAAPTTSAEAFDQARQLMLAGDYSAAEAAFRDYVARYGDTQRAPEARYWLGKTLTARGAHTEAAGAYVAAVRGWPQTTWAPDGTVELARSLIALRRTTDACQTLAEFDKRYPRAPAAVKTRATAARTQAKCAA
ncbi:MAG: tol-pal system protein YbgF [Phenylobacterium sp.]|uniref:tol-pal system protein YbgF n=1 Tax=Phenylobacterium sp. TaxID=1871053 RepID=UPI00391A0044